MSATSGMVSVATAVVFRLPRVVEYLLLFVKDEKGGTVMSAKDACKLQLLYQISFQLMVVFAYELVACEVKSWNSKMLLASSKCIARLKLVKYCLMFKMLT